MTSKVTIENIEYNVDDLSQKAKVLFDHVSDIEKQLQGIYFKLDQLQVCRNAFLGMLKIELPNYEAEQENG